MTAEHPTTSRRSLLAMAAVGVPALSVLGALNPLGASPAAASPVQVDGWWGLEVTSAMQRLMTLPQTGIVENQSVFWKDSNPGLAGGWHWVSKTTATGSSTIAALQRMLKVPDDGLIGPQTISALQARYHLDVDGFFGAPSPTIVELQKELNRLAGY